MKSIHHIKELIHWFHRPRQMILRKTVGFLFQFLNLMPISELQQESASHSNTHQKDGMW